MYLGVTDKKINDVSIYDKPYLYWNIGFHYYIKILDLEERGDYEDPVSVYLNGGSITYEVESIETESKEKKRKTIGKFKIYQTGKTLFNKIKSKISDKICKEWCKHMETLNVGAPILADALFTHQSLELIKAIEWVFANASSFKMEIPELPFVAGGAVAIAVLFLKINKRFTKLCNCEKIKKWLEEEINAIKNGIDEDIVISPIKIMKRTINTFQKQEQKQEQKNPEQVMIEILKMRLAKGKISIKEFEQLINYIKS